MKRWFVERARTAPDLERQLNAHEKLGHVVFAVLPSNDGTEPGIGYSTTGSGNLQSYEIVGWIGDGVTR
jgi:hypothetical protein